jgi:hypothetical protein
LDVTSLGLGIVVSQEGIERFQPTPYDLPVRAQTGRYIIRGEREHTGSVASDIDIQLHGPVRYA